MKSGFCGSSSCGDRDQPAHLADLRVDDLLDLLRLRARGTRRRSASGRVSFFGGGGASGLVRFVCVALTSRLLLRVPPFPAVGGLRVLGVGGHARRQARAAAAKACREDPFENRNWMLMISPLSTLHVARYELSTDSPIGSTASARRHPRAVHRHPRRGSGRRRALARRRRALGRVALTLVPNLDAVVAELVAPVLADERPDDVLVVGADVLDRPVAGRAPRRARAPR